MKTTRTRKMLASAAIALVALPYGGTPLTQTTDGARSTISTPATEPAKPLAQLAYERQLVDWATNLFHQAGLDLTPIRIIFSDTVEACDGNQGTVRTDESGRRVIRICADHDKPAVRDVWRRRALVHELAHWWEQTTLDETTRKAFMDLRSLTAWNDRTAPWYTRATEHAAEIMTWGLIDFPWLFVSIPDASCDDLLTGYRLLTGREPLNGPTVNCTG